MANLGAISSRVVGIKRYIIPVDTAAGRSMGGPTCYVQPAGAYGKAYYRDQWKSLSGVVKNAAGVGIPRRVIAIDNRDGALRGITTSAADGTFTLKISDTIEPVTVIAVPLPGDQRNALIYDAVTPV